MILAATPFLIHNWIAGFGGLVSFGIMYVIRVPLEEAIMRKEFGEAYEAYTAHGPAVAALQRLIPTLPFLHLIIIRNYVDLLLSKYGEPNAWDARRYDRLGGATA